MRLGALVLGLALALGLAQVWPWAQSRVRHAWALAMSPPGDCVRIHRRTIWCHDLGSRRAVLLSTLKPFCRGADSGATHNSHGFRGDEYTITRPPGMVRVSVLGDSFTWGHGVSDGQVYTRIAEETANRGRPEGGPRVEVLNHGVQGARFVDHVIRLKTHVEALEPDLVVVQLLGNDLYYHPWESTLPLLTEHDLRDSWWQGLPPLSLIRRSRPGFDQPALWKTERMRSYRVASREWQIFQEGARVLKQWSEAQGIPLLFLHFPEMAEDSGNYGDFREVPPELRVPKKVLLALEAMGTQVLDLTPVLAVEGRGQMLAVSATDLHPNALAHEIAGKALGRKLQQMALIRAGDVQEDLWRRESLLRGQASSQRVELLSDLDAQAAFFSSVGELHPGNIWNMEQLAVTEGRRGNAARAGDLYRHLSWTHPDLAAPWLALAHLTRGSVRRALLEKAVEQVPDEPDSALLLAPARFREGRQAEGCALVARAARNGRHVGGVREALALGRRHDCDLPEMLVRPYPGPISAETGL